MKPLENGQKVPPKKKPDNIYFFFPAEKKKVVAIDIYWITVEKVKRKTFVAFVHILYRA